MAQAKAALAAGDTGLASNIYDQVLRHEPDNRAANAGLIRCLLAAGDTGRARAVHDGLPPDAAEDAVVDAVNDTLKAIAASLLMEQVLAPRFNFTPRDAGPQPGFVYEGEYQTGHSNVGFSEDGAVHVEIKGLVEPKSEEARRIVKEDLNELVAGFLQDKTAIERGLFDEEVVPEELTGLASKEPDLGVGTEREPFFDEGLFKQVPEGAERQRVAPYRSAQPSGSVTEIRQRCQPLVEGDLARPRDLEDRRFFVALDSNTAHHLVWAAL